MRVFSAANVDGAAEAAGEAEEVETARPLDDAVAPQGLELGAGVAEQGAVHLRVVLA